jgi:hypothetical protein
MRMTLFSAAMGAALTPALWSQAPRAIQLTGDYALTHDPSIGREGNKYYVFATGKAPGGG